jgi:hypothetical protein
LIDKAKVKQAVYFGVENKLRGLAPGISWAGAIEPSIENFIWRGWNSARELNFHRLNL